MAIDPIYIHPVLGELTLAEVQDNAAYEEMSLEDYLSAFEVTLKVEEEEPEGTGTVLKPVKEGKTEVVAVEGVPVATEIDETSKLELELEGILSEYKKVNNSFYGDTYDGSVAGKMRLDERHSNVRSKLKKAYQNSEMDINKPMSIIDKTEEEVQSFLMNQ